MTNDELEALAKRLEAIVAASVALIDFHNGPVEHKRPDIFQRLMQRLANATPNVMEGDAAALRHLMARVSKLEEE